MAFSLRLNFNVRLTLTISVAAGPADIEATLLDKAGMAICGAYYISVRRE